MVKVLVGLKGSGKTKQIIELINAAHEACKAAVKEQMRIFGTLPLDI